MKKVYWALLALAVMMILVPIRTVLAAETCPNCGSDKFRAATCVEYAYCEACGYKGGKVDFTNHPADKVHEAT